MRALLLTLFAGILLLMLAVTIGASLRQSIFEAGHLFAEPWFVATLCDAYCGFLTFYVWVAYKEPGLPRRAAWFLAIMALGNIAMAVYMLWQLLQLKPGDSWEQLWRKREVAS